MMIKSYAETMTVYVRRHKYVQKVRGKASEKKCAHCGKPAKHWAYAHCGLGESAVSVGIDPWNPWSPIALCESCHVRYDSRERIPIVEATRKRQLDPEFRAKFNFAGRRHSAESKAKMSLAHKRRHARRRR
jgi:NUMOD3 motif